MTPVRDDPVPVEDSTMRRLAFRSRIMKRFGHGALGAVLALSSAITGFGQDLPRSSGDRPDGGGPFPRLPGAVTKIPDWIGTDAPFDVARTFPVVPRDRNAAPLYLDALFEFGAEMAVCFPAGPERDRRRE